MTDTALQFSSWALLGVLVRGLVLVLALWGTEKLIDLVPISRPRRRLVRRLFPVVTAIAVLLFLLASAKDLIGDQDAAFPYIAILIGVILVAALFSPFLDLIAGVFLKVGNVITPGDEIEVDGASGRIEKMGYRRMVILSGRGEVIIPYSAVAKKAIVRMPAVRGAFPHVFRLTTATGQSLLDVRRTITESALLCHWSAVSRMPQIRTTQTNELEVTVFAIHQEFGVEIEAAVRNQISERHSASSDQHSVHETASGNS